MLKVSERLKSFACRWGHLQCQVLSKKVSKQPQAQRRVMSSCGSLAPYSPKPLLVLPRRILHQVQRCHWSSKLQLPSQRGSAEKLCPGDLDKLRCRRQQDCSPPYRTCLAHQTLDSPVASSSLQEAAWQLLGQLQKGSACQDEAAKIAGHCILCC